MKSLLSVIKEPYSKGIRFSLRVISSDDVGFAIVEQVRLSFSLYTDILFLNNVDAE